MASKKHHHTFPRINIKYNRFLDPIFTAWIKSEPKWQSWEPPTKEEVLKRVEKYKTEWEKYEKSIIEGLYQVLDIGFFQNTIDVHIVSGNPREFSNPIIIKSGFESEEFVRVLTHELIHRLFANNKEIISVQTVLEMFPNENSSVSNHVPVFALLTHIYLNVLDKPAWLENDKNKSKRAPQPEYAKAWNMVEELGYQNVINKIKGSLVF